MIQDFVDVALLERQIMIAVLRRKSIRADTSSQSQNGLVIVPPFATSPVINVQLFGAAGDGVTDDTAAIQAALDASQEGDTIVFPTGTYLISDALRYTGPGLTITGTRGAVITVAPEATLPAVFTPSAYFTDTQEAFQAAAAVRRHRCVFRDLHIHGNLESGAVCSGIIMIAFEGMVQDCRIRNCAEWGIVFGDRNQHGHTTDTGTNLVFNRVIGNRIFTTGGNASDSTGAGLGGILVEQTDSSKNTDGWCRENSITRGLDAGIRLQSGQGWRVFGNQISTVRNGIVVERANNTSLAHNVINAAGFLSLEAIGERAGVVVALTTGQASTIVAGNTIHMNGNAVALADPTTQYNGIRCLGRGPLEGTKGLNITGNSIRFSGEAFAASDEQTCAIRQSSNVDNALRGTIANNDIGSDQGVNGEMLDTPIVLQIDANMHQSNNTNGAALIGV